MLLRMHDFVRHADRTAAWQVAGFTETRLVRLDAGGTELVMSDDVLILLCEHEACVADATCFESDGRPRCEAHRPIFALDTRPDPTALLSCSCGEALDGAKVEGVWTIGDTIAEYRTCLHCHSTKAWIARDVVEGKRIVLVDGDTFKALGGSLTDALDFAPKEGLELRRGTSTGTLLAHAVRAPDRSYAWRLLAPTREPP